MLTRSDLSPDQLRVYDSMLDWVRTPNSPLLTVGGYAGCLSGDTLIRYNRGSRLGYRTATLRDLYLKFNGLRGSGRGPAQRWTNLSTPTYMLSHWPDGSVSGNKIVAVFESGVKKVLKIDFSDGSHLVLTSDHPILTPSGKYVKAAALCVGDKVVACGTLQTESGGNGKNLRDRGPRVVVNTKYYPHGGHKKVRCNGVEYEYKIVNRARLVVEAEMNKVPYKEFVRALKKDKIASSKFKFLPKGVDVHHKDEDTMNDDIGNLEVLPHGVHAKLHGGEHARHLKKDFTKFVKVKRISDAGKEMTYDVQMEPPANNFVANGIFVHNTGKSTLLGLFATETKLRVAYICFTGRASSILGRKLNDSGVSTTNRACTEDENKLEGPWSHLFYSPHSDEVKKPFSGTIHRLLYRPYIDNVTEELLGWEKRIELDRNYDLVVIDEASMCDARIVEDLRGHGVRILAVGDHGQLPPVMSEGSLVTRPMLRLEKIHRQAEGSPIIQLSRILREEGRLARELADGVQLRFGSKSDILHPRLGAMLTENKLGAAVLCWRNATRVHVNKTVREQLGYSGKPPQPGEPLIALRNYPPIYNGMRGIVTAEATSPFKDEWWLMRAKIEFPDEGLLEKEYEICRDQFHRPKTFESVDDMKTVGMNVHSMGSAGKLFDFGYAMTVHKSQGSQFKHAVVVVDWRQDYSQENTRRLAYTAITRASEKLSILV
jgi:exodeoxyribonuclease-5